MGRGAERGVGKCGEVSCVCVYCVCTLRRKKKVKKLLASLCNLCSARVGKMEKYGAKCDDGTEKLAGFFARCLLMEIAVNTSRFDRPCRECTNWERKMLICLLLFRPETSPRRLGIL